MVDWSPPQKYCKFNNTFISSPSIHSFITWIHIAPLQGYYSGALLTAKKRIFKARVECVGKNPGAHSKQKGQPMLPWQHVKIKHFQLRNRIKLNQWVEVSRYSCRLSYQSTWVSTNNFNSNSKLKMFHSWSLLQCSNKPQVLKFVRFLLSTKWIIEASPYFDALALIRPECFVPDPRSRLKPSRNLSWMMAILWVNWNFIELLIILQLLRIRNSSDGNQTKNNKRLVK